jgi:hypothetical protein
MKIPYLFNAALPLFVVTAFAQPKTPQVLVEETFENPSEVTLSFPPSPGVTFQRYHPLFAAWANNGGQIAITYAHGFGVEKSGGLNAVVAKAPLPGGYLSVQCEAVKLPVTSPERAGAALRSLRVDFALNVAPDKIVNVYLVPTKVPAELKPRAFPSRLVMKPARGTGTYTAFSLKAGDTMLPDGDPFLRYIQDCFANGMTEVSLDVVWHLHGGEWVAGEGFQLDDVKISLDPRP